MKVGDPIPLGLGLGDERENLFVQARVFLEGDVEHPDSPAPLFHSVGGFYTNESLTMPNSKFVHCQYRVYRDAQFSSRAKEYPLAAETYLLDQSLDILENVELTAADLTVKLEKDQVLSARLEEDMLKTRLIQDEPLKAILMTGTEAQEVINIIEGARSLVDEAVNGSGAVQAAFRVWAWEDDNTAVLADATDFNLADLAGVNLEQAGIGETMEMIRSGKVPGALAGMGLSAGTVLYLSTTPGALTVNAPPLPAVKVIIGQAEPSTPGAAGPAEDLFIQPQLIG